MSPDRRGMPQTTLLSLRPIRSMASGTPCLKFALSTSDRQPCAAPWSPGSRRQTLFVCPRHSASESSHSTWLRTSSRPQKERWTAHQRTVGVCATLTGGSSSGNGDGRLPISPIKMFSKRPANLCRILLRVSLRGLPSSPRHGGRAGALRLLCLPSHMLSKR